MHQLCSLYMIGLMALRKQCTIKGSICLSYFSAPLYIPREKFQIGDWYVCLFDGHNANFEYFSKVSKYFVSPNTVTQIHD